MTKPLHSFFTFLAVCCLAGSAMAQEGIIKSSVLPTKPGKTYSVPTYAAEAISLKCEDCVIDKAYFVVGQDTVTVNQDGHVDMSALVFLPSKQETITFYSGTINADLQMVYITGTPKKPIAKKTITLRTDNSDCAIQVVPPSVWRTGLIQPNYTPGFSTTNVIAVHHGDSPNTAPTYEEGLRVLRSYYNHHTSPSGNNWSDIGYNYLIGPDGTIFLGREKLASQTGTGQESDKIIAAHLCAKNTNTMGICLIGRYTSEMPTAKTLESLYKLIKWKAAKDNIDLNSKVLHPVNPTSSQTQALIPRLIGHREGPCGTSCPGDFFYNNHFINPNSPVRPILNEVGNICAAPLGLTNEDMNYIVVVYPNPTNGQELKANFDYKTVSVYGLDGKQVRAAVKKAGEVLPVTGLTAGTYLFHFDTPDYGKVVRRVVVN
ncbi:N-acetylmuramoyl-L-alanine amidase [Rufibacter sp. LB8]|uniref:N-acetylmuramoyl-L-alanine amidase n=1 Tax=Rufibacter sp. LB8 TaxID=2777781 RepID=UPI00178C540D|nr:N-acetylmuramoyl-L-alanine amidase [Rufibacter sp. LB8]